MESIVESHHASMPLFSPFCLPSNHYRYAVAHDNQDSDISVWYNARTDHSETKENKALKSWMWCTSILVVASPASTRCARITVANSRNGWIVYEENNPSNSLNSLSHQRSWTANSRVESLALSLSPTSTNGTLHLPRVRAILEKYTHVHIQLLNFLHGQYEWKENISSDTTTYLIPWYHSSKFKF
jgi:hypothetical protein